MSKAFKLTSKPSLVKGCDTYPSSVAGDPHGTTFDDIASEPKICEAKLIGIRVRHGSKVDSVQCIYSLEGKQFNGPHNGGQGGREDTFYLNDGELIVKIEGRSGYQVDGIQFFTNRGRQSDYYGGSGGSWFGGSDFSVNPNYRNSGLQYFSGTSADVINSIQGYWTVN